MDIFFYEAFEEEANALRSMLGNDFSYGFAPETIQEAGHSSAPARLVSIRTQSLIPFEWDNQIDGILSRSTGYDHLLAYASSSGTRLPLGYLEEYATRAVAEHAIMLAMALMRKLPQQMRQFPSFNRDGLTGVECEGRNLLVVGVGRIGREIVSLAQGVGFVVKGVDIVTDEPEVTYVSKENGVPWADVIVNAMNLTTENRGYFSFDLFSTARRGLLFVNIARGEHSPLAEVERALAAGRLGGLGLDVFEDEGNFGASLRNEDQPASPQRSVVERLLSYPNVILTPHNAFNSEEALRGKSALTVRQVKFFLKNKDFLWKI
jgi:D-lactate dehydrogenase